MSISDRVCPTHDDVGALPHHNNCPECGAQLVSKGIFRSAAEAAVPGLVIGAAVGGGLEVGEHVAHGVLDGIGDFFSS